MPTVASSTQFNGDILLLIGGKQIALGKSCSVSMSLDTGDTTSWDSGTWTSKVAKRMSWSVSNEAIFCLDSQTKDGNNGYDDLFTAFTGRVPVAAIIKPSIMGTGDKVLSGNALITKLDLSGELGSGGSISISMEGDGPLTLAVPVA